MASMRWTIIWVARRSSRDDCTIEKPEARPAKSVGNMIPASSVATTVSTRVKAETEARRDAAADLKLNVDLDAELRYDL